MTTDMLCTPGRSCPLMSHTIFTPSSPHQLKDILHSWKSYTGTQANLVLGRSGRFWQREYYDHAIRDQEEFEHYVWYTLMNPVKAGLCVRWQDLALVRAEMIEGLRKGSIQDRGVISEVFLDRRRNAGSSSRHVPILGTIGEKS